MATKNPPKRTIITPGFHAEFLEHYYAGRWVNIFLKDGEKLRRFLVIADGEFTDHKTGEDYDAVIVNEVGNFDECDEEIKLDKIEKVELAD